MRTDTTPALRARSLLAGEVATQLGVGVQTLHYYEREGLLPLVPRSASGYRLYGPALIERLTFIRKAQALGLPLGEIKDVLDLIEQGTSLCGRVEAALAERLREVDARLRELRSFRNELAALIRSAPALCAREPGAHLCAIVEEGLRLGEAVRSRAPLLGARRARADRSQSR
jgi:DNA-binding transcriptional MerR regulator